MPSETKKLSQGLSPQLFCSPQSYSKFFMLVPDLFWKAAPTKVELPRSVRECLIFFEGVDYILTKI